MKLLASRSGGAGKREVEYCVVVTGEMQGEKRKLGLADLIHAISPPVTPSLPHIGTQLSYKWCSYTMKVKSV
jgi:hypothetical protein